MILKMNDFSISSVNMFCFAQTDRQKEARFTEKIDKSGSFILKTGILETHTQSGKAVIY